jgi:sec-independent protein translocase protein TatA
MPHLGPLEIGLILLLVLIVFGVGKLPEVGSALGRSLREFNRAKTGEDEAKTGKNTAAPTGNESKKTT